MDKTENSSADMQLVGRNTASADLEAMKANTGDAAEFLKALAHEGRLTILCHLVSGEKTVRELEEHLSVKQSTVSQHLARLRFGGLVSDRRVGKTIRYRLADDDIGRILEVLHERYCD